MPTHITRLKRHTLFANDGEDNNPGIPQLSSSADSAEAASSTLAYEKQLLEENKGTTSPAPLHIGTQQELPVVPTVSGSPWNRYKSVHQRKLGGTVTVVLKLPAKKEDYIIKNISSRGTEMRLLRIPRLSHENLCKTHEMFEDSGELYAVLEPVTISLRHVCRCPDYPTEEQLVAITKQMLAGICFLNSQNLTHDLLDVDNVLINSVATVKIASLEYCRKDSDCAPKNSEAFGRIAMMLMDKFAKENGEIGVRRPHKWSELAVSFLSAITACTPDVLRQHDFMQQEWSPGELRLYVSYVQMKAEMD